MSPRRALLILAAAAACACAASPRRAGLQAPRSEEEAVASVLDKIRPADKSDYRIGPADLLNVSVYQQPDLQLKSRVGQNGSISMPLIGTVKVGGLSVSEAEKALAKSLDAYLVSPQVTVFIEQYGNKKVFILGEVAKPGSYDLPPEAQLTVLEAVSLAGGFTPIAAPDRTKVIRRINGKNESITIAVSDITKRGERHKDASLEPNDVVFVPQSLF